MQTQVYSIDEIREIVAPIAKQHGVDKVFLFGSYARGDATPASDVDLCVDAPKLRGLFALGGLYADLEDALKKSIDVVTTGSLKYNKDEAATGRSWRTFWSTAIGLKKRFPASVGSLMSFWKIRTTWTLSA